MSYARGPRAWGICQRSGKRLLRKDMVEDGHIEGLLVAPEWYEPRHPQELPPRDTEDPIAIYKPSPEDRLDDVSSCALIEEMFSSLTLEDIEDAVNVDAGGEFLVEEEGSYTFDVNIPQFGVYSVRTNVIVLQSLALLFNEGGDPVGLIEGGEDLLLFNEPES